MVAGSPRGASSSARAADARLFFAVLSAVRDLRATAGRPNHATTTDHYRERAPRPALQMASQLQIMHPQWLMDNLNWVELQERLDDDE